METTNSKTVFIEYSTARKGQHFMTVVQTIDHERIIIGRIFREYNPEIKKSYYQAYDFNGDQIFGNGADISELKNKFKKSGKFLADMAIATRKLARQQNVKLLNPQKEIRKDDLKAVRNKKTEKDKEKTKDPEKGKITEKSKLNQMEKEQDAKNSVQYKDLAHIIDKEMGIDRPSEKQEAGPNPENEKQEDKNLEETEMSERDLELEQIRSENEERDQDIEMDR